MLTVVLFALAVLRIFLNLWQLVAGLRFPLHRKQARNGFAPALSLLRPVKGLDSETEACLESWFLQKYDGEFEILFGVASETDPICPIIRRLIAKYPRRRAELVICDPVLGANAKVSSLCYLAKKARFGTIIIADQDVFVRPDFTAELVVPLADAATGLVNCFYIQADPRNFAMKLEAVAVNSDFWTQVLQGNMLKPMDFALGAVIAVRKENLERIGGFEALLDYLGDDYQLGNRVARGGSELRLCSIPVECRSGEQSASAVWKHQLRWARTIRVCQPAPYFFSILSNATLWPLLYLVVERNALAVTLAVVAILLRIFTAQWNYRRLTRHSLVWCGCLGLLKDLLNVVIWALSFAGNEVVWRGQRFHVNKGGKLTRLA
jgi:ceramide glucosyltransferase